MKTMTEFRIYVVKAQHDSDQFHFIPYRDWGNSKSAHDIVFRWGFWNLVVVYTHHKKIIIHDPKYPTWITQSYMQRKYGN